MLTPSTRLMCLLGAALAAGSCAGKQPAPGEAAKTAEPTSAALPIDEATAAKLRAALAGPHRSEANRARDVHRHPFETLGFFGLRDDMTVLELWPGGGWYTEVLAPVLRDRGKLVVTNFDVNGPPDAYPTKRAKELQGLLEKDPGVFGKVEVVVVDPKQPLRFGPSESADMVLTFRNLHNWVTGGTAEKVLAAAFDVLRPGGVLGVVDHRGRPGLDPKSGYIEEADAIRIVEAVGFQLAEKSEINANAKDTKDHPEGVWTLPPVLRLKERDRAKYEAIGESDRFTLKFVKPRRS